MKWKTRQGDIIDIRDMSDAHLQNAYKLEKNSLKNPEVWTRELEALHNELERRLVAKFTAQTRVCPWCQNTMEICSFSDVDHWFGYYRFVCKECGAQSNKVEYKQKSNK